MDFLYASLGLVILLLAGDALVRGAVNLALRLGIPALIVSLTIVAFGTSAPELLISIDAVIENVPGIALGNVVGSNIANILLVLGIPALIRGLQTGGHDTRRSYLFMMAASIFFVALCFLGPLTWMHEIALLVALSAILFDQARQVLAHRKDVAANGVPELEGADPELPWWRIFMFLGLGLVGLPLGADLLVDAGVNIARSYGVSDAVIGLTLIAVGTSLPELATTVMACMRNKADVALGNVIGSNMFNLLAIIGLASLFGNIPVAPQFLALDLWIMLGASLLLAPFVFRNIHMTRPVGAVLTALYVAYLLVLLV